MIQQDLFNAFMQDYFAIKPTEKKKERVFTKSSIIPQEKGGPYRASVTYFTGGNSHSVMEVLDSIDEAEAFIATRLEAVNDNTAH